ncbi:MAG: PQQ-binding-like beta-propeller repeat protein [Fuerstiella sp.]|nr:PQQ-binding-like beta-propeller repeat protein [Fuerstiella sp.]MCP4856593.1 PQQ-binding-like beta-propeller repeat protein [Fuerstiella sp.]
MNRSLPLLVLFFVGNLIPPPVPAADWPMWRNTSGRTAASTETLPDNLQHLWTRRFAPRKPTWDDPLNLDLMTYDRVFEPIVLDGRLFVGFNDRDKLAAFDTDTGEELWSFFTEAPVRLPPAGWDGHVYFCSDDGFLYCVDAEDGHLEWRFRGAPNAQHAIGNQRLTSAWPARGGPVIRDGHIYFAASIWPFMGTFLYALDARTGEVEWVNDSTGSQFIKQPHSAPSFAGVAPQGALVATDELLLVPGGRSVPAAFDRRDGKLRYFEINAGGKGTGGTFLVANEQSFFVHTRLKGTREFKLKTGVKTAFMPNEPVLHDGLIYSAETDKERHVVRAYQQDQKVAWQVDADGRGDLILAGDHLYAAGPESICAIRLPDEDRQAKVSWSLPVDGRIGRLLAADGKLFAVTVEGDLLALGAGDPKFTDPVTESGQELDVSPAAKLRVSKLLLKENSEGYAFWFGASDASLIDALAADSPFTQLAVVDQNAATVASLRRRLDKAHLYGQITAHHSEPRSFMPPSYVANLVVVGTQLTAMADETLLRRLYEAVRPYGGAMQLLAEENQAQLAAMVKAMNMEQAHVEITDHSVVVRRVGALPGSADWTHQHGDIANTIKSNDKRVKLPLGVLWFGGSSNMDVLPRHGHGPPEQVVGGRLFIEGMNSLSARDVYTGRVLWKREFKSLGTHDVYYDDTYENTPLNAQYNQVHIPGANGRGTNYVATEDRLYIVEGAICHVLDPATGETLHDIAIGSDDSGRSEQWGYIGVYDDVLIGGLGFAMYRDRLKVSSEADAKLKKNRAGFGLKSFDRAASVALVGFDRHTGERLWKIDANHSFWHNGIVAGGGRLYCLDRNPKQIEELLIRRGQSRPEGYRIAAFDAHSGKPLWEYKDNIFGSWLGYSESQDLLLQAGAAASDRLYGEVAQGMAVYSGIDGSQKWQNESIKYAGPCILHNNLIITNANSYTESAGAFRLSDGQQKLVPNPVTGELQPWKLTRAYGCNNIVASENLLTFRSGAAGFYDLLTDSGTGNFGGFKSGCTSNLVVANGVLNAPDYTRTCSCAYQNQTSLALVHMPEVETWSVNAAASAETEGTAGTRIRNLGVNFGAPGDRRDANGLLWLEYPVIAGPSPPLSIVLNDDAVPYQHHSSTMSAVNQPWIMASGVTGVTSLKIKMKLQNEDSFRTGLPVAHINDDAEENDSGSVAVDSSDLELVEDSGSQLVGLRFNDLNLSRGTKIRGAYIQFTCDEPSDDPAALLISAQDVDNAARFSSDQHDLSSRTLTRQQVAWNPGKWARSKDAGEAQRTPDLAELVQSVVNRADWRPGNSLAFLISGTGKRVANASRGNKDVAARLVIDADEAPEVRTADEPSTECRVRLFFAAPPTTDVDSKHVFDVQLQGQLVLNNVHVDSSSAGDARFVVHTVDNVAVANELNVQFVAIQGSPVLSGIELLSREDD